MRILIAHVGYRLRGGEDAVVDAESRILSDAGHEVRALVEPSSALSDLPLGERLGVIASPANHEHGSRSIAAALGGGGVDVCHFHNTFPLLGVSAARAAVECGAATIRTLHNWRLSCLAGTHLLAGEPCYRCRPGHYAAGIVRGCYRGSVPLSVEMARYCRADWDATCGGLYDMVLTVNPALRESYVHAGLDEDSVRVKYNSVDANGPMMPRDPVVVYVGRLSDEKGIGGLVKAWPSTGCELVVAGDGPLSAELRALGKANVTFLGEVSEARVEVLLSSASGVILPSLSQEGPPVVLLKALAAATPIVAFKGPTIGDVVSRIDSTLTVPHGDFGALVAAACRMVPYSPELGLRALCLFEERFTHARNRAALESAYHDALARRSERAPRR